MSQKPLSTTEARRAARRRKRKRVKIMRISIMLAVILLLCLVGALIILRIVGIQSSQRGDTTQFLAVKAIEVEGQTRYSTQEIIEKSGLYVGQSLLGVNKVQAHNALLKAFPYLSRVEVSNSSFDTLHIAVEETPVMGAVKMDDGWMMLGANNHALELVDEDKLPAGTLHIVGASLESTQVGTPMLDERSLHICQTIVAAAQLYKVDCLTALDLTEKTNISIMLNGRLQVILGNETNLKNQMEALAATLPTLWKNNGKDAGGRLDMSSYSDDNPNNNKAIYTPPELLAPQKPKPGKDSEKDTSKGSSTATSAPAQTTSQKPAA